MLFTSSLIFSAHHDSSCFSTSAWNNPPGQIVIVTTTNNNNTIQVNQNPMASSALPATLSLRISHQNLRGHLSGTTRQPHQHAPASARFFFCTYSLCHSLPALLSLSSSSCASHSSLFSLFQSHSPPLKSSFSSMTTPQATSDPSSQSSSTKTVRVAIKGRVQGVFYRNWTVENATQLGLKGWVRNRRDGSVEALFSGDPDKVQEMEQRCRRGPPDAMVTGLQVFPCNDDPGTGFECRSTV